MHPYQFTSAPTKLAGGADDTPISQLPRLTKALDQLAKRKGLSTPKGKGLDLYLTEFGYLSAGNRAVAQSVRAAWLRYVLRPRPPNTRVKQILQFQLVDPPAERALAHGDHRPQRPPAGRLRRPRQGRRRDPSLAAAPRKATRV